MNRGGIGLGDCIGCGWCFLGCGFEVCVEGVGKGVS